MPLTVLTQPFLLTHSDVPIPFEVQAGNDWQVPTSPTTWGYILDFSVMNLVPAGKHIYIWLFGQKITVTTLPIGTVSTDWGLFVEENPIAIPVNTWLTTVLVPALNQNYLFATYCTFNVVGTTLFINAPYPTNLVVSTDIPTVGEALVGVGSPAVYPENYHIILDVYISTITLANEVKVATLKAIPEKTTPWKATFDLREIISSYVKRELPSYNQITVTECTDTIIAFRLAFAEGLGTEVVYRHNNEAGPFLAVKGGIPYQDYPSEGGTYLLNSGVNRFLTWQPQRKITSKTSQEYLYYYAMYSIFAPASILVDIQGVITYDDGSDEFVTFFDDVEIKRFYEYIIPAGYDQLNLGAFDPSKKVVSWYVEVYSDTYGVLAEQQQYQLDHKCADRLELQFLFGNSLNGFDTLRTTTPHITGIKVEREEAIKRIGWDYEATQGQRVSFNQNVAKRIRVNTGWVSLEYIKYLQEFLTSNEVYHITEDKFLPVMLVAGTTQLYENESYLYSLSFEFEYTFNANSFAQPKLIHI